MKIGEFSRKYGVNATTVRYYIDRALLTPERRNGQYVFNETCCEEMERIKRYKSYRFSLSDIELLFFLEKTSRSKDETVIKTITGMFEDKRRELENERTALGEIVEKLSEEIEERSSLGAEPAEEKTFGIPFHFIPYLVCPKCGRALRLESVDISDNLITKGSLRCGCGYEAVVRDGVIMCDGWTEDTPFKSFDTVDSVHSITDEYSDAMRMLVDRTYMWMYHHVPVHYYGTRFIMAGPFTSSFILKYCDKLGEDALIIVIDPSIKKIMKMRHYMDSFNLRTVYIASDIRNIPLKKGCVDLYIDDYSVSNSIFTYNESIYGYISPLMRKGSTAVGIFWDYTNAPETLKNYRRDHPDFITSMMSMKTIKSDLLKNGMKFAEVKSIGKTGGSDRHFPRHIMGEPVRVMGYMAKK